MRNLGALTRGELGSLGFHTVEDLAAAGWQEVCVRWAEALPVRANVNAFAAVIGAIDDVDWRKIDPRKKEEARRLVAKIKLARRAEREVTLSRMRV